MRKLFMVSFLCVLATGLALGVCGMGNEAQAKSSDKLIVWRYCGIANPNDASTKSMLKFAKLVGERSGGRMRIDVYPAGQLYSISDFARVLPTGMIEMAQTFPIPLGRMQDTIESVNLPLYFDGWDHVERTFIQGGGNKMLDEQLQKNNMKLIFCQRSGQGVGPLTRKKAIRSLEDMKGLRIRIPTKTLGNMVKAWGGAPVYTALGELYTALDTGMVDGVVTGATSYVNEKYYEVCRYLTTVTTHQVYNPTVANLKAWKKLPKDIQDIMMKTGQEIAEWVKDEDEKDMANAWKVLKEKGVEYINLSPEEFARWKDKVKPLYDSYRGQSEYAAKILDLAEQQRR